VLASLTTISLTTIVWNAPPKSWTGGATTADALLNRRMTVRLADAVAFAQVGIMGVDGQIEPEALRLYALPEAAQALLCDTPTSPVGQREFALRAGAQPPPAFRRSCGIQRMKRARGSYVAIGRSPTRQRRQALWSALPHPAGDTRLP
jgi:hypothetical protein